MKFGTEWAQASQNQQLSINGLEDQIAVMLQKMVTDAFGVKMIFGI